MQNIEQLTRSLGAALQLCPQYVRCLAAKEQNDADEALQGLMRELELVRMQYKHEVDKGDTADEALMDSYEKQFHALYANIMKNGNMQDYQEAAGELDKLVGRVVGILQGCAQGEDPATFEPEESGCGGDCGGCKGCH